MHVVLRLVSFFCYLNQNNYMLCFANLSISHGVGMPLLGLSGPYISKTMM